MFHGTQSQMGPGLAAWLQTAGLLSGRDLGPQGRAPGWGPGLGVTAWGGGLDAGSPTEASADSAPTATPSYCRLWVRVGGGFIGRAPRAGGPPASSQPRWVSARGGPGSLPGGLPLVLQMRTLRPEVAGRGWGRPLGLPLSPGWLMSVAGGLSQAQGRGDPSLSHGGRGPHR